MRACYRPNTVEELLVEYDRYYDIFESCSLFFDWAKAVLSEKTYEFKTLILIDKLCAYVTT